MLHYNEDENNQEFDEGPIVVKGNNSPTAILLLIAVVAVFAVLAVTASGRQNRTYTTPNSNDTAISQGAQGANSLENLQNDNLPNAAEKIIEKAREAIENSEAVESGSENLLQEQAQNEIEAEAASGNTLVNNAYSPLETLSVSMPYSFNSEPVYSVTLDSFRSDHTGCDYAASLGTTVFAAADGKVAEIYTDEKYGISIVLDHGNGMKTGYSNLSDDIALTLNQTVKAGDPIAFVGNSALYESADDSHLHFSVSVDGEFVDPQLFFPGE